MDVVFTILIWLINRRTHQHAQMRLRQVICDQCSLVYHYHMQRSAEGYAYGLLRIGSQQADLRAQQHAMKNLDERFEREAEPVPCPGCGWINEHLGEGFAQTQKYGKHPTVAGMVYGLVVAMALAASLALLNVATHLMSMNQLIYVCIAMVIVTPILATLLVAVIRLRRRRKNWNEHWPDRLPELPTGTPRALLQVEDDQGQMIFEEVVREEEILADADKGVHLRLGLSKVPDGCCGCLEPTDLWFEFKREQKSFSLPFCKACHARRTRWIALQWLIGVSITLVVLGGCVILQRWGGSWALTGDGLLIASVLGICAGVMYPLLMMVFFSHPFNWKRVDMDRGIIWVKAKNPAYNQLLQEMATQQLVVMENDLIELALAEETAC